MLTNKCEICIHTQNTHRHVTHYTNRHTNINDLGLHIYSIQLECTNSAPVTTCVMGASRMRMNAI